MSDDTDHRRHVRLAPQGGRLRHPQHHRRPDGDLRRDPDAGRPPRRARAGEDRRRQRQPLDRPRPPRRSARSSSAGRGSSRSWCPTDVDAPRRRPDAPRAAAQAPARPLTPGPRVSAWRAGRRVSTLDRRARRRARRAAACGRRRPRPPLPGRAPRPPAGAHRLRPGRPLPRRPRRASTAPRRCAPPTRTRRPCVDLLDATSTTTCSPGSRRSSPREPVEDLRIDLEDGYGTPARRRGGPRRRTRGRRAARRPGPNGTAPAGTGIRFKSFEAPTRRRGRPHAGPVPRAPRPGRHRCPPASW